LRHFYELQSIYKNPASPEDVLSARMLLYDVVELQPTKHITKETDTAIAANPSPGADRNTVSLSKNSIPASDQIVNDDIMPKLTDHNGKLFSYFNKVYFRRKTCFV